MDCEHYIPGGVCGKDGKVTGALKEMCGTEKPVITNAEKYCRKCGRTLPIDQFSRSGRSSDGGRHTAGNALIRLARAGMTGISRHDKK